MRDEEFEVIMPSSLKGLLISSIAVVIGLASFHLAQSVDIGMAVAILAVPSGLLFAGVFGLITLIDFADISPYRSIKKLGVSDSGITLYRKDKSVASEMAWREVVDMQYSMLRRMILGTEVGREPDSLSFTLTGGRTFKIPLAKIIAKEKRPGMVRSVTTHLAAAYRSLEK